MDSSQQPKSVQGHKHTCSRRAHRFDLTPFKANPLYERALAEAIRMERQEALGNLRTYTVRFAIKCKTIFGQSVKIVGNDKSLGDWNHSNALQLVWSEGDVWVGELSTDSNIGEVLEYKVILVTQGSQLTWEKGENHRVLLTEGGELREGKVLHLIARDWKG